MSKTRFIIVRHGETTWNVEGREMGHRDSPLTPLGVAQAQRLGARLATFPYAGLYSSDLGRAATTARMIAGSRRDEIEYDSRLRERHMGVFQGLTRAEMESQFPQERAAYRREGPRYVIPDGESADQRIARALRCLEEIAARRAGDTLVVVTHGGILMGLFESVLGLPFGSAGKYLRPNCAWNAFSHQGGEWQLETWGDVSHLQSMDDPGPSGGPKDSTPGTGGSIEGP